MMVGISLRRHWYGRLLFIWSPVLFILHVIIVGDLLLISMPISYIIKGSVTWLGSLIMGTIDWWFE